MIPYDSVLLDPPMLFGSGWLAERVTRRLGPGRRESALDTLRVATITVFWVTSVSLYLNRPWTTWIWKMCRAESGRDWMINSGVFSFEHERPSAGVHALSAAILATYPLWFKAGVRVSSTRS
ncbi:MAG: hypothetical protein ABR518_00695 [Actinomycetota bacterium]